ncbi:hypothetical protein CSA80_00705 [Candidatus Saccharibacteria bacterium]|nr:MAG: hypothetical protein CSA80_00705 [Candidatus Saccharibacteria bacterium]
MHVVGISVLVPLLLFFGLPRALGARKHRLLLASACLLFAISWYLPSPDIDGRQTAFMTHVFGGGVFCGLLAVYLKNVLGWRTSWWREAAALFALVSSLGVINELFEVVLWRFNLMPNGISDTSWDLVANTLGALLFFLGYKAGQWSRSAWTK